MKKTWMIRVALVAAFAMALTAAFQNTKTSAVMAQSAEHFLVTLSPELKAKATFALTDDERQNWHFTPVVRKGLPLREMDGGQRAVAQALLITGLSQRGYAKAMSITSLEPVLREQERDTQGRRDPYGYFFSVFGDPSDTGNWGWRFEGHHVALNYTLSKGQVIASPTFFGANPAEMMDGPRKGFRPLGREEDLARDLLLALDDKQKPLALVDPTAPRDIVSGEKRKADPLDPKGIPAAKLNKKQQDMLMTVIEEYTGNMPDELANARMDAVKKAGLANLHFAWLGSSDRGKGQYYRIQGPTFLIEYDNTQNNANHVHSVWRDFKGDFGLDMLASHYQQFHLASVR